MNHIKYLIKIQLNMQKILYCLFHYLLNHRILLKNLIIFIKLHNHHYHIISFSLIFFKFYL